MQCYRGFLIYNISVISGFIKSNRGLGLDGVYAARVYDAYQAGDSGVGQANDAAN